MQGKERTGGSSIMKWERKAQKYEMKMGKQIVVNSLDLTSHKKSIRKFRKVSVRITK